jgi:hypothetical protein
MGQPSRSTIRRTGRLRKRLSMPLWSSALAASPPQAACRS